MRALIQRVASARVEVNGEVSGEMGRGLLVLLGIAVEDEMGDVDWLAAKVAGLRVFEDAAGVMNLAVSEAGGGIMLVSQFTLMASTRKGNRPSYVGAARPEVAAPLYEAMKERLEKLTGRRVATGVFGADMQVHLINDGPVTILVDSRRRD